MEKEKALLKNKTIIVAVILAILILIGSVYACVLALTSSDDKKDNNGGNIETVETEDAKDNTNDTSSKPTTTDEDKDTESKPTESKPEDTSSKQESKPTESKPQDTTPKPSDTVSTPSGDNDELTEEEQKRLIEKWLNSPAPEDEKQYYDPEWCKYPYEVIEVVFTRKATKENLEKEYTLDDFPEVEGKYIEYSASIEAEAIKAGIIPWGVELKTFRRSVFIVLKDNSIENIIKTVKRLEKREDIYMLVPQSFQQLS